MFWLVHVHQIYSVSYLANQSKRQRMKLIIAPKRKKQYVCCTIGERTYSGQIFCANLSCNFGMVFAVI